MRLSFTKLDLYEFCPYAYRFRYVLRIPVPFAPRLTVGASVHAALKGFFERLRDGQRARSDDLYALYDAYWDAMPRLDRVRHADIWERGLTLLRGFWAANRADLGRPVLLEARFRVPLAPGDRHTVEGIVDRVDEIAGGAQIIDYKSGTAPPALPRRLRTQLHIYAMGAERKFGLRPLRLTAYFLGDNRALSTMPDSAYAARLLERFESLADSVTAERFEPTPGQQCATCDYAERCPHRWNDAG